MKHRIVVLGGGYAGVHAAGRLARRLHADAADITLINASTDFVERVRLHEIAVGEGPAPRKLVDIFDGTGVALRCARASAIDVEAKVIVLDDGEEEIFYDSVVYALGSGPADPGVPGAREHAEYVADIGAASRLRSGLAELAPGASVLVVGAGLTGLEMVTEIAESRPDLDVSAATRGGLGDWLGSRAQSHIASAMRGLGITVYSDTEVRAVDKFGVTTGDGRIDAQLVVFTAGFAVHPIAAESGVEVCENGRVVVDSSMRSVSHPDVYAIGDAASARGAGGAPLRMACGSGIPMGWRAADSLALRLAGRSPREHTIRFYAQFISLGRRDGIAQPVDREDRAKGRAITGRVAARLKEFVCRGAAWALRHPTLMRPVRRFRVRGTEHRRLSAAEVE